MQGVLTDISNNYDVMGLIGNGASHAVQMEAGIESADLLIAATDSDELNLLCCLIAKKAGGCNTIARVRNPVYNGEIEFIKEELGLSLTVNPEFAAATEAARVLRFPSAVQIETFAKGKVEIVKVRIPEDSVLQRLPAGPDPREDRYGRPGVHRGARRSRRDPARRLRAADGRRHQYRGVQTEYP